MGNKSRKPSSRLEGNRWVKHRGRDPERFVLSAGWRGLQPEAVSRGGFDVDPSTLRKVARPALKVRE